jgi:hypothetical protein
MVRYKNPQLTALSQHPAVNDWLACKKKPNTKNNCIKMLYKFLQGTNLTIDDIIKMDKKTLKVIMLKYQSEQYA